MNKLPKNIYLKLYQLFLHGLHPIFIMKSISNILSPYFRSKAHISNHLLIVRWILSLSGDSLIYIPYDAVNWMIRLEGFLIGALTALSSSIDSESKSSLLLLVLGTPFETSGPIIELGVITPSLSSLAASIVTSSSMTTLISIDY